MLDCEQEKDDIQPQAPPEGSSPQALREINLLNIDYPLVSDSLFETLFSRLLWSVLVQSLILQIAQTWLEQELKENEQAKVAYMSEHCPAPDLSGDQAALMVSPAVT